MTAPKNGRPRPCRADPLANILGPLDGAQFPGGCEHCDAYQTVGPIEAGVWHLRVFHDEDCPMLAPHRPGNESA